MSKFGWSYPPGCSGTPYDDDYPCTLCGVEAGLCHCPECGICGEIGNPDCYDVEGHGMAETAQQEFSRKLGEILLVAYPPVDYTDIYANSDELLDDFADLTQE